VELAERVQRLREEIDAPAKQTALAMEQLAEAEAQLAAAKEVEAMAKARARLLAIQRADGSLDETMAQDLANVVETITAACRAVNTANDRFEKRAALRDEARHLATDHGLPMPKLRPLHPPGLLNISTQVPGLIARMPRPTPSPKQQAEMDKRAEALEAARQRQHAELDGALARTAMGTGGL
jgi:hypothetical protein